MFGTFDDPNVIAMTIVWGIFDGPPFARELMEWEMIFGDTWNWGDADVSGTNVMDVLNIATHELGHAFGLADLYTTTCTEETMFGYANYGETKKRDLNAGDIAGIRKLYP